MTSSVAHHDHHFYFTGGEPQQASEATSCSNYPLDTDSTDSDSVIADPSLTESQLKEERHHTLPQALLRNLRWAAGSDKKWGESSTFPRSTVPPDFSESLDEIIEEMTDDSSETAIFNRKLNHSISDDQVSKTSEMSSSKSFTGSPLPSISPDVQSRLSQLPRRGSDNVTSRYMKNRSRSVMLKLQVPQKYSPSLQRRVSPSTSTLESKSSPDIRERSMTYSGGSVSTVRPTHTQLAASPSPTTPIVSIEDDDKDEDLDSFSSDIPPSIPSRLNSIKRNSFLYLSDTDEPANIHKVTTRSASISNSFYGAGDEVYITPFAQILSNLQSVRNQFITLTNPPISEERKRKSHWTPPSSPITDEDHKALALLTLDELDSCLHRLETVNSGKSMGTMAQDKFRRILSRELSHLSERSRSGHFVAEWVNNLTGTSQDYDEIDKTLDTLNVIQSSQGFEKTITNKPKLKSRNISVVDEIPRFGISGPNVNYDGLEKFMDKNLDEWGFDSFTLNFLTSSQPLVALGYTIFKRRELFTEFKIPKQKFINFMSAIQSNYWTKNSYHNAIHAADVLHATNYLLNANALENIFTDLEIMASLVSAAIHDVDHPGRTNQFLVNTSHELAIMYNDESVLENHHLAVSFKILKEDSCNFLENVESAQQKAFRRMVIDSVLATDMTKHLKHLGDLKTKVETKKVVNDGILQLDKFQDRSEVLQCLLHCADLNNPAKPPEIASSWAYRIMEESFEQGDEEKRLGIDVGPLGDRENVCIEKCQVSFIEYVIFPLWETWGELVYPDAQDILDHLSKTKDYWSTRIVNSPLPNEDTESNNKEPAAEVKLEQLEFVDPDLKSPSASASVRRNSYRAAHNSGVIDHSLTTASEL